MNRDHKLDSGTAQNLNSLLKDPSASTNNIGPTTKEKAPLSEYLQRLGDDHVEAGLDATADDIYEAAAEIRKLTESLEKMNRAMANAADRQAQLSAAIFGLIEDHVQTVVENEVQTAIDDYDPTDHPAFGDAVDQQVQNSSVEDTVRELLDNVYISFRI